MTRAKTMSETRLIDNAALDKIIRSFSDGNAIRENLAEGGRLHIDRPLPFLCVYRQPSDHDDKGTAHLIMGEASYLLAPGDARYISQLRRLIESISKILADKFGAFLIIEIWAGDNAEQAEAGYSTGTKAKFRIFTDREGAVPSTVDTLAESLESIRIRDEVEIRTEPGVSPPGMEPLMDEKAIRSSCLVIGLEVFPIYRDVESGEVYRSILAELRREFSKALQHTFFEFVHVQTPELATHPQMLGRRSLVDAVWAADAELSALSDTFNYLLAVTPVNSEEAFDEFKTSGFEKDPVFHYRLLTIDPEDLKRQLYSISFDEIEDPTMAYLLRDKRIELDRQITLIEDRNTPRFLYESLQLYPPVEAELLDLANEVLNLPRPPVDTSNKLDAGEVEKLASVEIEYYRERYPEMAATVEIRKDTPPGMMVSHEKLLIGHRTQISAARINALLQHEVGTHLVTYFNGRAQPLKLLYSGLPGYEQLQEGLAVFTEYLVGGLTLGRLRTLAARVVAVQKLTAGRNFAEVFIELRDEYKFTDQTAFNISMRVFRGGGLTKDAVYLRGLTEIVKYFREGGDIETLLVGKMGPDHVSIIRELQWREVLRPAPLIPRYMTFPETTRRLEQVREIASVCQLVEN
ncbi:flavohemoglobin expression-modulating QEGLA motif protein [soil metagenome]